MTCLKRVANARSQLAALEPDEGVVPIDPEAVTRLEELEAESVPLRKKAESRFGGGSARQRLAEIEAHQRVLLDELGVTDLAEARQRLDTVAEVDATLLEFARRELEQAEAELAEVLAMDIPEPEPEPDEPAVVDDPPIDLRDESAAS